MKRYKNLIVVFLLIYGLLFGPNFYIAGISLRVLTSSIALVILFFKRRHITVDNVFYFYTIYTLCYILVSLFNGEIDDSYFVKGLLNWHLPCILLYLLIPTFTKNKNHVLHICYLIIGLLVFNVLLSIGQYANFSLAWNIGNTINVHAAESVNLYTEKYDVSEGFLGLSIINGMCASVVDNGYFIATTFPLCLILLRSNEISVKSKLGVYILMSLCVFASFAIQQRMGFYLIMLFILYNFWKSTNGIGRFFILLGASFFSVTVEYILVNIDIGRLAEANDSDRANAYINSIMKIFGDDRLFVLGGEKYYRQFFEHTPHNTIIGAWVYSGIIGFIIYVQLLFNLIKRLIPLFTIRRNNSSLVMYSLASCCLMFLAYSMTHSTGIHNGKALYFWLFYGLYNKYEYYSC